MASRITIASLTAQIASLTEQNAALSSLHDGACVRIAELEAQLAARPAAAPVKPAKPAYVPPAPSAEVLARRAAMAAAKQQAIDTGRSAVVAFS